MELVSKQLQGGSADAVGSVQAVEGKMVSTASKLDLDDLSGESSSATPAVHAPAGKGHFARAIALNKPELPWAVLGLLGAALNGALFPV